FLLITAPSVTSAHSLPLVFRLAQVTPTCGVAGGDALLDERIGYFGDELQERQTGVDVACALARLLNQRCNVVAGDVEQPLKSFGFFVRMHVNTHRVFDQRPLQRLCVVDLDDAGGDGEKLCQL